MKRHSKLSNVPRKRTPGKRNLTTVELTTETADSLETVLTQTGLDKKEFFRRVLTWYLTLPREIQADALGHLPDGLKRDVAKLLLERMRDGTGQTNS